MKIVTLALFASLAMAFTASASPELLVETTITQNHAEGGLSVEGSKHQSQTNVKVKSGESVVVVVGQLECTVTPTLKEDGNVEVRAVFIERKGDQADQLAAPLITTKLGQTAEVKVGDLAFAAKITLAK
jgi:hypothetical protein